MVILQFYFQVQEFKVFWLLVLSLRVFQLLLANYLLSELFEIHLVSSESLVSVKTDLAGLMGSLGTSSLQTFSFVFFNVDSDYIKFIGVTVTKMQVKIIYNFLYFEQDSLFNSCILCFTLLFFFLQSRLVALFRC